METLKFEIWENMPVKMSLPWWRQVPDTATDPTKLFPDKFRIKSESLAAFG